MTPPRTLSPSAVPVDRRAANRMPAGGPRCDGKAAGPIEMASPSSEMPDIVRISGCNIEWTASGF
jgi:hypothetical protein